MGEDWYANYAALSDGEKESVAYRICFTDRASLVAIVAPHGGWIEPKTSQITAAIAGDMFSLYSFEGLQSRRVHCELHITSLNFDEPRCLELVRRCLFVVTVHGRADLGDKDSVWLGGSDIFLRDAIADALENARYQVMTTGHMFMGTDPQNICNRGQSGAGVQLELPRTLRQTLSENDKLLGSFVTAIRHAISWRIAES